MRAKAKPDYVRTDEGDVSQAEHTACVRCASLWAQFTSQAK